MNSFKLPPAQRLTSWSEFRDSLTNMPEAEQLTAVAEFWQQCPFDRWVIDPLAPKEWMSVWEMLYSGQYCINCVAVGIEATLRYSGWDPERLQLVMIQEADALGSEFFVVKIDNMIVLNYSYGKCVPVDDLDANVKIMYTYQWKDDMWIKL
jgi:hypothetical protein